VVRRHLLTFVTIVALVAAACSSSGGKGKSPDKAGAAASTTAPVAVPSVTVTAREYGFDVPPEIEGGVVRLTLQNDGKLKHEAVIVAAGATPPARLARDLTPIVKGSGTATPGYIRFQGGVSLVAGGTSATSTLALPAGNYVMVCTLTDADSLDATAGPPAARAERFHYELGMAVPFAVKATNTAVVPPTDGTVLARDWSFELPALTPGTRTLTFRNDGQQDHSLAVAEFADGVDPPAAKSAFDAFLAADAAGRPPPDDLPTPDDVAFAGPLSTGGQATFTLELKPDRTYVFACYMSDRTGGPRHATGKGMVAYATTPAG
jgi:uncharacterized cupredoxin-like copper-binding protein